MFVQHCSKSRIVYVNCNNSSLVQTGESWQLAYNSLQSALLDASTAYGKVYIHIAQGLYIPSEIYAPNGQIGGASGLNSIRLRTFNIPHRTMLIGGFNGTEDCSKQSNPDEYETLLSGINYYWHVVTCGNDVNTSFQTTIVGLCNLTIIDGNAQGPTFASTITAPFKYDHSSGGGLYIVPNCHVKVSGVTVRNNKCGATFDDNAFNTGYGGGIYCVNSNLKLKNSSITNNSACQQGGGVEILNVYEGDISHCSRIENCIFENNSSVLFGGAMVVRGTLKNPMSNCVVKDCRFVSNNTSQEGGAVVIDSNEVKFNACLFKGNISAVNAGALATTNIVNAIASSINGVKLLTYKTTLQGCTFDGNVTLGNEQLHREMFKPALNGEQTFSLGGGAVSCYVEGILDVNDCVFKNNIAQNGDGGALINGDARVDTVFGQVLNTEVAVTTITDSVFINNTACFGNGGALADIGDSTVILTVNDSKFKNNTAPNGEGNDIYVKID